MQKEETELRDRDELAAIFVTILKRSKENA
jgi:hypothetical protein